MFKFEFSSTLKPIFHEIICQGTKTLSLFFKYKKLLKPKFVVVLIK